ncbi:Cys-tRNA(Pro) deacylase [Cetobacterium sp. 2A]|uniref:Cys-tRNA(Pro) deacylase n=1 Tax=unclassified Cetobacterium TaxID=2630983 RepID=UPI00163CEA43|nr:Cys-tRNA(Pro) deacylase [Cetobacterium sp. 2A]MBC2854933.1 Cys-tRNA(Pro) deacylase [Cetobacterium sp. 2A]
MSVKKTNAIREIEKSKIPHKIMTYEVDENNLGAINVSLKTGADITKVFKTLALFNEKKELIIACVPGSDELDLKKLAKLSESKKVEMIDMKSLLENTGYIRGGCSPVGIKKRHKSFIHQSALLKDTIIISGGARGIQLELSPNSLIEYLKMIVGDIIV